MRWHCSCADAVYRGESRAHQCKHVRGLQALGRGQLEVTVAGYLGPIPEVAALALERYRQALRGEARMTCDLCIHRTPMAGFEDQVGTVQRPHPHPHDHDHAGSHG